MTFDIQMSGIADQDPMSRYPNILLPPGRFVITSRAVCHADEGGIASDADW